MRFKKISFCLILFQFLGFCVFSFASAQEDLLFVAHRGANALADENTIKAYSLAVEYGMNFIECDPRLTRDGVFVIMHDRRVERTTNGKGEVSELSLSEIKSLRTKSGENVPTFEEVLEFAKEKGIGVYVDTKLNDIEAMEKMIALIRRLGMNDNVIVGIWWNDMQKWLQKNHPEIKTCLSWPKPLNSLKKLKEMGVEWVGTTVGLATEQMVKKAHKLGLKVITLEINDVEKIKKKMEIGLDAIQTDDPRLIQKAMERGCPCKRARF